MWLSRSRIVALSRELASFHGYRTIWIDPQGLLCHSEPDEELELRGHRYLATLMRPDEDVLSVVLREAIASCTHDKAPVPPPAMGWEPALA